MNKKYVVGFIYVSICILAWGTLGSLVDYPLLQQDIYQPGSLGQLTTFLVVGILTTIISIILFKKLPKSFIE